MLETGSASEAVEAIANTPALRAEAAALLPALAAAVAPAGDSGVASVLGQARALFHQTQRSDEEEAAWWSIHFDALSDIPMDALEAAMRAYIRSPGAEFMPKPGRLRELASLIGSPAIMAYGRAKRALAMPVRSFTPEDVATRRAQVADILTGIGKAVPNPSPTDTPHEAAEKLRSRLQL